MGYQPFNDFPHIPNGNHLADQLFGNFDFIVILQIRQQCKNFQRAQFQVTNKLRFLIQFGNLKLFFQVIVNPFSDTFYKLLSPLF